MKVRVTQEDISRGMPRSPWDCPVALALKRQTSEDWSVGSDEANTEDSVKWYALPLRARKFIIEFDADRAVEPFEFEARKKKGRW